MGTVGRYSKPSETGERTPGLNYELGHVLSSDHILITVPNGVYVIAFRMVSELSHLLGC